MRLLLSSFGLIFLLASCQAQGDPISAGEIADDDVSVLVDMDADQQDLDAMRVLFEAPDVVVEAVSLSLTTGLVCEEGVAAVTAVLDEQGQETIPISCDPSAEGADALASFDDALLGSIDQIVVLGPLTNIAALLERLPRVSILVTTGMEAGGISQNLAADPQAARRVFEQRTVTVIPPSVIETVAPEVLAAWLTVDETLGSFTVEDVELTSSGTLTTVPEGLPVRILRSVDTARLTVLAGDGEQASPRPVEEPRLLWRTDIGLRAGGHHKRPAVADDLVVVGGSNGEVHGISIETGEIVWTVDTGLDGTLATGVAYQDNVAVLSGEDFLDLPMFRKLVAVDTRDPSVLWTFDPETISAEGSVVSSPAIADDVIYAGTVTLSRDGSGVVFALDRHTGELLWQSEGFGGASEPLVADDDLVLGGWDGTLRIYDRHSGQLRWERALVVANNGIASRPLVDDGVVYVTGDDGSVHSLDQASGEVLWSLQVSTQPIPASPILAGGRLIVAELFGGTTRALDPSTGEELWAVSIGHVLGDPVVAGETVIVGTFDSGTVLGLDVGSGETSWEFHTSEVVDGSPVVVDDILIIQAGDIFALDLPDG